MEHLVVYFNQKTIIDRKSDIYKWFEIKEESSKLYNEKLIEIGVVLDDNLCVINFRGGEYRGIPNVLLEREYWKDSINYMLSINRNMKFLLITDDAMCK
jgi:hypothetical protein